MQIKGYGKGRITDAKSPVHSDLHTDKTNELHLVTHTHVSAEYAHAPLHILGRGPGNTLFLT